MSVAPRPPSVEPALEVLGFGAAPAGDDVAVLRLEGRFAARSPRRLGRPRLVFEDRAGEVHEAPALAGGDALAGPDAPAWRASFAAPRTALDGGRFALAVGRDLLLDLPAPHVEEAPAGHAGDHVRLARELNALRHELEQAQAALQEERAARAGAEEAQEEARRDLRAARAELEALRRERPEPATEEHEGRAREGDEEEAASPAADRGAGADDDEEAAPDTATTVRVLTPRTRRPRLDLEAEAEAANDTRPLPGAARIGAEHIERAGQHRRSGEPGASSTTRAIAVAAIALFALVLALVVLGLGPV